MGERAPDVTLARAGTTLRARSQTLAGEIATVREELDVLLAELDRRWRGLLNVRLQLRRHAVGTALTTLALVGAAAGAVWLSAWRHRRRQRPSARADRLREAMSRMTEHPERVAAAPTMAGQIATAAASAAAVSLVKKALEHAVGRLLEPQRDMVQDPSRAATRKAGRLRDEGAAGRRGA